MNMAETTFINEDKFRVFIFNDNELLTIVQCLVDYPKKSEAFERLKWSVLRQIRFALEQGANEKHQS